MRIIWKLKIKETPADNERFTTVTFEDDLRIYGFVLLIH